MKKKFNKFIFFPFLVFIFVCLSTSTAFAALEVSYPAIKTISGGNTEPVIDLPSYVKYLFDGGITIGIVIVLLSLAVAGATYFFAPLSAEMRKDARDRIAGAISGLLILLLTYLIISTINPQLNIFNNTKLEPTTVSAPAFTEKPGVYFCPKFPCGEPEFKANTTSVLDFGDIKKNVKYILTIPDQKAGISYTTIMYENPNLWGKCQYFNGTSGNSSGSQTSGQGGGMIEINPPFGSSASVFVYEPDSTGDGVYFFRKPCFNDGKHNTIDSLVSLCKDKDHGGYYKVSNSDIKNGTEGYLYNGKFDELNFEDVPEEEQTCTKWDKKNNCIGRGPVSLGGENISSVIINGNYLVVFIYMAPTDKDAGPWTACQEFPVSSDLNKAGPRQVKWDIIRNSNGVIPNFVLIIPVKQRQEAAQTLNPTPAPASTPAPIPIPVR